MPAKGRIELPGLVSHTGNNDHLVAVIRHELYSFLPTGTALAEHLDETDVLR